MSRKAGKAFGKTKAEEQAFIDGFVHGSNLMLDILGKQVVEMKKLLTDMLLKGDNENVSEI